MSFLSYSRPPEVSDDSRELRNKLLREKNVGHVVHRDRRKNRFYEFEPRSMGKFVCFVCAKLGLKFVQNKIVSCSFFPFLEEL
jgi:hypothetical protein